MKKYKQGLATSLSALSTAILCHTTVAYASDIEIYKAPTTGGATLMLALDFSTSMTGSSPIKSDFFNGNRCTSENHTVSTSWNGTPHSFPGQYCWIADTRQYNRSRIVKTYTQTRSETKSWNNWGNQTTVDGSAMTETENLSDSEVNDYSGLSDALKEKITNSCVVTREVGVTKTDNSGTTINSGNWNSINWVVNGNIRTKTRTVTETSNISFMADINKYSCPDRVTMLKKSLYDLIAGNSTVNGITTTITPLVATASIGFTTFPNPTVRQSPLLLSTANRTTLLTAITSYSNSQGTPIANAYAVSAKGVTDYIVNNSSSAACAGYGVYFLTDGEPYSDNRDTARTTINSILSSDAQITSTQCSGTGSGSDSWKCVEPIAKALQEKKNIRNTEIKTAIVGFGSEFSFNDSSGVAVPFSANYTADQAENLFTGSNQKAAARAATLGKGGWFSADNTNDIVSSVTNFVNSIRVEIPAITTGTSAIPQDALNTSAVQPYAYFPQFQPKPSENYQAWAGNLKKYKVVDGILKDKNDTSLFSSAGSLNQSNEDLWTLNYAATTTLTAEQQNLKSLGGLLSRLNLKKTGEAFNRKVYTNNGTTIQEVTEAYIKQDNTLVKTRGYYLGLMGYDITPDQVNALTTATDLSTLNASKELRQIGAVMHSTPLLLTQSGQITHVPAKAAQAATADKSAQVAQDAYNDTTNRDDYILFGTTQGVLHVVRAGKESEISTVGNTAGQEVFAFVPQEMLDAQGPAFLDPPNTPDGGMSALYYGVDGPWTAHTEYVYNSTDEEFKVYDSETKYGKQWVYGGMRMGGRSYYALDLTKITALTDNQPKVKFRINPVAGSVDSFNERGTAVSTSYASLSNMGQSWSKPTIANVQWKGKRRLVMFVGGGYDSGYERFNYDQTNGIGAGIYMFDANTGELLWSTYDAVDSTKPTTAPFIGDGNELKYSVVSQVKVVDREGDGDVDHLYFGDLGGQVFRIDLNSIHNTSGTARNYAKQITRIYNGHVANGVSPRFYEMPAFTVYSGTGGLFAVISIGSGNRSTPLLGKKVNNTYIVNTETDALNATLQNDAIYNIYDTGVTKSNPAGEVLPTASPTLSNLYTLTSANRELLAATGATAPSNLATNKETTAYKGWYYPFVSPNLTSTDTRKAVEKVQGDLIALDNDLYVSTFDAEGTDSTESCGAGIYGTSRAHRFCMPYGQCENGDTVSNNTLSLGKGLLGITIGPGSDLTSRRIITPLGTLPSGNKITGTTYNAANKLIPQSWYEKN